MAKFKGEVINETLSQMEDRLINRKTTLEDELDKTNVALSHIDSIKGIVFMSVK